jgi:hypothetical protein
MCSRSRPAYGPFADGRFVRDGRACLFCRDEGQNFAPTHQLPSAVASDQTTSAASLSGRQ